jgi:hypothetical protein
LVSTHGWLAPIFGGAGNNKHVLLLWNVKLCEGYSFATLVSLQQIMSYSTITTPLKSTSNPTQMSPTEITTKPLVSMSSGLLVDYSRNIISMDLIVIFYFFSLLLPASGMGHIFLTKCLKCSYSGMSLHSPMQLYFTWKVFAKCWRFLQLASCHVYYHVESRNYNCSIEALCTMEVWKTLYIILSKWCLMYMLEKNLLKHCASIHLAQTTYTPTSLHWCDPSKRFTKALYG